LHVLWRNYSFGCVDNCYTFGFQAVLERGVLTYFNSRADAATGFKRKDFKYLDGANILPLESDTSTFVVHFSDSAVHRLSVVNYGETTGQISRQVCFLLYFETYTHVLSLCALHICKSWWI
jgi:hypothetical protein